MSEKRCPHCGLWNAETARRCDCGFDFTTGAMPASNGDLGNSKDKKFRKSLRISRIGLGASILAVLPYLLLAGFYLSRGSPAHRVISSAAFAGLLPGFFCGFIFGLAGLVLGILGWARAPRSIRIFALSFSCVVLSIAGIIGNIWFYDTCQFCQ
jgi:hypothetical protein